ncbi:AAA family ATPase [Nodosilinea sp. FACHB-13]|uniref:AAA family ATPase n=1 Tax=Cyanophyceae TaxID=3028117 RepID=UPI0016854256|nr:AAA family ATPase [Nodosilinea sp. FACHB-13]MBD2109576.1 ATP-binding protein [Nodosilinea sp. FACHB-13]
MLELQQFYDACDPTQPLRGKRYYIDFSTVRGGDIVQELERKIARLARNRPTTQLFTGHIGCGKSTELFRLQDALVRRSYEVVYFESDRDLEMADVEISDILLSIAHNISEHLDKLGIATRPTYLQGLFQNLADTLRTPMEISDVSFSAGIASITASAKQSPDMRSQLRQYLEPRTRSIITAINDELLTPANDRLQEQGKNRLVVIMDNLDRIDSAPRSQGRLQSEYIFVDRGEQLRQLDCHMVYTIPLELMFSNDLVRLSNRFGTNPMVLPMVPMQDRKGNTDEAGMALLRQMVLIRAFPDFNVNQRIDAVGEVFDEMATLDRLCQVSGGHMRNLIRLLDGCLRKQDPPFLRDTLEAVIRNERDSLMGLVSDHEWDLLLQAVSRQDVQGDEDYNILVRSLFLYEYRDAQGRWFGPNPLLAETDRYRSWLAQQSRP